jgi:LuxR family transcriptional regulator
MNAVVRFLDAERNEDEGGEMPFAVRARSFAKSSDDLGFDFFTLIRQPGPESAG